MSRMLHGPRLGDQFLQAAKPVAGADAPNLVQLQVRIADQQFNDVRLGLVPAGIEFERDQVGDRHNLERTVFTHDERREPHGIFDHRWKTAGKTYDLHPAKTAADVDDASFVQCR